MKFQLLKLIIWPKSEKFAPRIVEFEPGKVNVITGVSRTGKSAIIPIIDYCLASTDCFIPIGTVRDNASWYGIVFQTETEQVLISRKVPNGNQVSNDFYLYRGQIVSIPPAIKEANEKTEGVKNILNTISSVPYFSLEDNDEHIGYKARLGFRDLMALVFQNQDIVANQNILFYKTHAHEHRERLRNWFPFILGAESIEILRARQRFQEIEKRLNQKKREFEKAKAVSSSWMTNMLGYMKVAKEYGLLEDELSDLTKPDDLLADAKYVLEHIPEYSLTKFENIEKANKEMVEFEAEEKRLSTEIGVTQKRLNDIKRLKLGLIEYGDSVKKRVDRLHISQWLEEIALESQACPACGSTKHPNSTAELIKISSAFKKYEDESKRVAEVPSSFSREEERINSEMEILLEKKKDYHL
jgi:heat shock protein HspQ